MTIEPDVVAQARDFRVAIGEWAKTFGAQRGLARQGGAPVVDAAHALRLWSNDYAHPADNDNAGTATR